MARKLKLRAGRQDLFLSLGHVSLQQILQRNFTTWKVSRVFLGTTSIHGGPLAEGPSLKFERSRCSSRAALRTDGGCWCDTSEMYPVQGDWFLGPHPRKLEQARQKHHGCLEASLSKDQLDEVNAAGNAACTLPTSCYKLSRSDRPSRQSGDWCPRLRSQRCQSLHRYCGSTYTGVASQGCVLRRGLTRGVDSALHALQRLFLMTNAPANSKVPFAGFL